MARNGSATEQSLAQAQQHFPGLDALRALAILLVIPRHAWEELKWPWLKLFFGRYGWMGVDLFFVLSGFLIGSQLFQTLKRRGSFSIKRFYFKRALRILPCYFVVLLLYLIWPAFRETPEMQLWWRFATFTMNIAVERGKWAFSHAWSLCIEEHFYLLFPAIVILGVNIRSKWFPAASVCLVLVGGLGLRYLLWSIDAAFYPSVYRPTYTHLDGLTVGVALALIREYGGRKWDMLICRPWFLIVAGLLCCSLGGWLLGNLGDKNLYAFTLTFPLVSLGFGAFVATALAPNFWLANHKVPGASMIAALAYSLYLTHKQMIHLAVGIVGQDEQLPIIGLSLVLMVAAAAILHLLVERPCLRFRDRLLHQRRQVLHP